MVRSFSKQDRAPRKIASVMQRAALTGFGSIFWTGHFARCGQRHRGPTIPAQAKRRGKQPEGRGPKVEGAAWAVASECPRGAFVYRVPGESKPRHQDFWYAFSWFRSEMTKTFVAINDPVHSLIRSVTRHTPLRAGLSTDPRLLVQYSFQEQDLPEAYYSLAALPRRGRAVTQVVAPDEVAGAEPATRRAFPPGSTTSMP